MRSVGCGSISEACCEIGWLEHPMMISNYLSSKIEQQLWPSLLLSGDHRCRFCLRSKIVSLASPVETYIVLKVKMRAKDKD